MANAITGCVVNGYYYQSSDYIPFAWDVTFGPPSSFDYQKARDAFIEDYNDAWKGFDSVDPLERAIAEEYRREPLETLESVTFENQSAYGPIEKLRLCRLRDNSIDFEIITRCFDFFNGNLDRIKEHLKHLGVNYETKWKFSEPAHLIIKGTDQVKIVLQNLIKNGYLNIFSLDLIKSPSFCEFLAMRPDLK